MTQLLFLGTGAGCGVPSFFCNCVACQEAMAEPRYRRTRCGLMIRGEQNVLVDTPPELRTQLLREGINHVDHLLLTHGHYDHSGGLGDMEFYLRVGRGESIPAYMSAETRAYLVPTFGFIEECFYLQNLPLGYQVEIDGIIYTALEVTHAPGTFGLLLETAAGRRTAYIPDTGPLPPATAELLHGVDRLILGATFWGRNWMPEDHLSVTEAVDIALKLDAQETYLTHVSMHHDVPVTNRELEAFLRQQDPRLHLAYDGLELEL